MKKRGIMRGILRTILLLLVAVVLAAGGLIAYLTAEEYKPEPVEMVGVSSGQYPTKAPRELSVLTWNIGYAGLGKDADFFMDGGRGVRSADRATVEMNTEAIRRFIQEESPCDFTLLQEVDANSARSHDVNEIGSLRFGASVFALNYSCPFVPYPLPPIGRVTSFLLTCSGAEISRAERIALPCPYSWPMRVANLKRCLLVSYIPVEDTDKQLVLVNVHLEAYDDGEGREAQTRQLRQFAQAEYERGNYVIIGGDFNQTFSGGLEAYPMVDSSYWTPTVLTEEMFGEGWRLACDLAAPSCRLLNQPYNPEDAALTQHYVQDGFVLSPNVELTGVETVDLGFEHSDHNPVRLEAALR